MTIAIIELDSRAPAGMLQKNISGGEVFKFYDGDPLPSVDNLTGLIVLGGRQNAHDPDLAPVAELLAAATAAGVNTLGVCLGAQLLATTHGGRVEVSAPAGPERGIVDIKTRPGAEHDPVLGKVVEGLGREFPAVNMHNDAITDLPSGATWLASSRSYPYQAFRFGSALGVQFHPEVTAEVYGSWMEREQEASAEQAEAQWAGHEPALRALAEGVAKGFALQPA